MESGKVLVSGILAGALPVLVSGFSAHRGMIFFMSTVSGDILFSPAIPPLVHSHGEGRASFDSVQQQGEALVALRYLDNAGRATEVYPYNPNGSPAGITGVTTADGRFTIMMPHPERVFRNVQMSWYPRELGERGDDSARLRMFRNARVWVG